MRAKSLSRSTSIPEDFKVEYFSFVIDFKIAEYRIHLLLDEFRFNPQKEFFLVNIQRAKDVIKKVAAYCNANYCFADALVKHRELIDVYHTPKLGLRQLQLLDLMMSQSHNNTLIDHLHNLPNGIVSGFLTPNTYADWLSISNSSARNHYKKFADKYSKLEYVNIHTKNSSPMFDFLKYSHGELAWSFSREARQRFISLAT